MWKVRVSYLKVWDTKKMDEQALEQLYFSFISLSRFYLKNRKRIVERSRAMVINSHISWRRICGKIYTPTILRKMQVNLAWRRFNHHALLFLDCPDIEATPGSSARPITLSYSYRTIPSPSFSFLHFYLFLRRAIIPRRIGGLHPFCFLVDFLSFVRNPPNFQLSALFHRSEAGPLSWFRTNCYRIESDKRGTYKDKVCWDSTLCRCMFNAKSTSLILCCHLD